LQNSSWGTYGGHVSRHEYLPTNRRALEVWSTRLLEIVEDLEMPGNVVAISSWLDTPSHNGYFRNWWSIIYTHWHGAGPCKRSHWRWHYGRVQW